MPQNKKAKDWGIVHFFDKVAGYQRDVSLTNEPKLMQTGTRCLSDDGSCFDFQKVTKKLYDERIRQMFPNAPALSSDEEVQRYLQNLNPF